jgi:hypothetical protein
MECKETVLNVSRAVMLARGIYVISNDSLRGCSFSLFHVMLASCHYGVNIESHAFELSYDESAVTLSSNRCLSSSASPPSTSCPRSRECRAS